MEQLDRQKSFIHSFQDLNSQTNHHQPPHVMYADEKNRNQIQIQNSKILFTQKKVTDSRNSVFVFQPTNHQLYHDDDDNSFRCKLCHTNMTWLLSWLSWLWLWWCPSFFVLFRSMEKEILDSHLKSCHHHHQVE